MFAEDGARHLSAQHVRGAVGDPEAEEIAIALLKPGVGIISVGAVDPHGPIDREDCRLDALRLDHAGIENRPAMFAERSGDLFDQEPGHVQLGDGFGQTLLQMGEAADGSAEGIARPQPFDGLIDGSLRAADRRGGHHRAPVGEMAYEQRQRLSLAADALSGVHFHAIEADAAPTDRGHAHWRHLLDAEPGCVARHQKRSDEARAVAALHRSEDDEVGGFDDPRNVLLRSVDAIAAVDAGGGCGDGVKVGADVGLRDRDGAKGFGACYGDEEIVEAARGRQRHEARMGPTRKIAQLQIDAAAVTKYPRHIERTELAATNATRQIKTRPAGEGGLAAQRHRVPGFTATDALSKMAVGGRLILALDRFNKRHFAGVPASGVSTPGLGRRYSGSQADAPARGKAMRVLISNIDMRFPTGTVVVVRDFALNLARRGHAVVVYAPRIGEAADALIRQGIRVVADLAALEDAPEVIHGHHNLPTIAAMTRFPDVPAIWIAHGRFTWFDSAPRFRRIHRYLAVDTLRRDILEKVHGVPPDRIGMLPNAVDLRRIAPRPQPLPEKPATLLAFAKASDVMPTLGVTCARLGLKFSAIGIGAQRPTNTPEEFLVKADIVVATGRAALEAICAGAAVIVGDGRGVAGMATTANWRTLRNLNFGTTALIQRLSSATIEGAIAQYDAADATTTAEAVRADADLELSLDRLERLYREAIAANPPPGWTTQDAAVVANVLADWPARDEPAPVWKRLKTELARMAADNARRAGL